MSFGIRTALLAAQSASSKVVDGIGRTLGSSDIGKLRPSKGQTKQDVLKLENLLSSTWKKLQDSSIGTSEKYKHFGRIAIRSVMFTLQKKPEMVTIGQAWKRLRRSFMILSADPSCYDDKVVQSNPSSTSKEDAKNAIVDLQQSQNPYFLALQSHGESTINVGSLVTYAVDGIYEVVKYEATGISMKQRTLFGTGEPFAVDLKDVGSIKLFKGVVPKLIDDGIVENCFPTVICTKEEQAAQIFVAMMELYNSQDTATSCLQFSNAGEVYSKHKMSKGELTLVPCTDSTSKIVKIDPSEVGKLTKMSVGFVSIAGKVWKILPPKPLKEHGGDWKGVAVPFFMCKPASVGQMITKKMNHKGYAF